MLVSNIDVWKKRSEPDKFKFNLIVKIRRNRLGKEFQLIMIIEKPIGN